MTEIEQADSLWQEGHSTHKIAQLMGRPSSTVRYWLYSVLKRPVESNSRKHPKWTSEQDAKLRELWGDDLSRRQIGEIIDKQGNAVIGRARRLGLPFRKACVITANEYSQATTLQRNLQITYFRASLFWRAVPFGSGAWAPSSLGP
jgi:hypothetical protein